VGLTDRQAWLSDKEGKKTVSSLVMSQGNMLMYVGHFKSSAHCMFSF
jgi:hypothetical protein